VADYRFVTPMQKLFFRLAFEMKFIRTPGSLNKKCGSNRAGWCDGSPRDLYSGDTGFESQILTDIPHSVMLFARVMP